MTAKYVAEKDMQTPIYLAEKIAATVKEYIEPSSSVLEPFYGDGNLFNALSFADKHYLKDFSKCYDMKVDWVVTNPPFKMVIDGKLQNSFIMIVDRLMKICEKGFYLLINANLWNSLTVKRLTSWYKENDWWALSYIKIFEVKEWYGRWYLIRFEKNVNSVVDF